MKELIQKRNKRHNSNQASATHKCLCLTLPLSTHQCPAPMGSTQHQVQYPTPAVSTPALHTFWRLPLYCPAYSVTVTAGFVLP